MDLLGRVGGIFFNPRRTFDGLAARPVWIDALVVVLLALIAFNLAVLPYAQKDNLSLIKDNAALRERMGEDIYAKLMDRAEHPSRSDQIVKLFVTTPLFYLAGLLLQSLLLLILGRFVSTQGTYVQALSALVHASLIDKLLGNGIRLVLSLSRGSVMQTSTSLALLFPRLEATSTSYIMLAQIDFFQLWLFGVLAIGLSSIFKIAPRKALVISYGVWVLKALANIGIGLIGMSLLR
jgi:hypothetical protein